MKDFAPRNLWAFPLLIFILSTPAIAKKETLEWNLGIEFEYVHISGDTGTIEPNSHFQLGKLRIGPKIHISDSLTFEAEIDIKEDTVGPKKYFFKLKELPLNGVATLGKQDRFFYLKRFTERYPLISTAFTRDEEVGLQYHFGVSALYAVLSISQGLELDLKEPGKDASYKLLHDDEKKDRFNGIKEFAIGIGSRLEFAEHRLLDVMAWAMSNSMTDSGTSSDVSVLQSNLPSYISTSNTQWRLGLNLETQWDRASLSAQGIYAKDGALGRSGWFIQPAYLLGLNTEGESFKDLRLVVRYGQLKVDTTKSVNLPASWDRTELTLGTITHLISDLFLKVEYTIDSEETGGTGVSNDEFLAQLNYSF